MTFGQQYIKDSYADELSYNDAIAASMREARAIGINCSYDVYDNDSIFDNPIYPCNAELYDEFCDEYGFDTTEYFCFLARRIESENLEKQQSEKSEDSNENLYSAVARNKETKELVVFTNCEYRTKADFIKDIRANGYSVNPVKVKKSKVFDYIMNNTNGHEWDWKENN